MADSSSSPEQTVIAGRKPVLQALRDDAAVDTIYLRRGLKRSIVGEIKKACGSRSIPLKFVPQEKLDRMATDAVHQGVVATTSAIRISDLNDLLIEIAPTWDETKARKPLLLILDRISDPHNLGAIVRSAAAFGCSGVILPERHSAPLGAATIKASAGTALNMPFARVTNVAQAVRQLKERGYWIAGLAGEGRTHLNSVDWDRPIVLVVGSEADGISDLVRRECDMLVSIPIVQHVESLNASVAAGIALQAAGRSGPAASKSIFD
jgi:23S rRNA (guanosine2251-2'-O)-methyltransferase